MTVKYRVSERPNPFQAPSKRKSVRKNRRSTLATEIVTQSQLSIQNDSFGRSKGKQQSSRAQSIRDPQVQSSSTILEDCQSLSLWIASSASALGLS